MRRALNGLLVVSAALFVLAMAFVVVRAVTGGGPIAQVQVPSTASPTLQFGAPALSIPRGGVRTVTITTQRPTTPLVLRMRLSSSEAATFSGRTRGTLRASRPEVVFRGQEFMIPLGRPGAKSVDVEVYAKGVPTAPGPPIVVEEVRVAWDASPSTMSQVVVWSLIITGPLFLILLIIRFAIGPTRDH